MRAGPLRPGRGLGTRPTLDRRRLESRPVRTLSSGARPAVRGPAHWVARRPALRVVDLGCGTGELTARLHEELWAAATLGIDRSSAMLASAAYARALRELGFEHERVEQRVYTHVLEGPEEVVEWVKGTTLTDYERRLGEELYPRFLARYRERVLAALAPERPFCFPFKRILFWARSAG